MFRKITALLLALSLLAAIPMTANAMVLQTNRIDNGKVLSSNISSDDMTKLMNSISFGYHLSDDPVTWEEGVQIATTMRWNQKLNLYFEPFENKYLKDPFENHGWQRTESGQWFYYDEIGDYFDENGAMRIGWESFRADELEDGTWRWEEATPDMKEVTFRDSLLVKYGYNSRSFSTPDPGRVTSWNDFLQQFDTPGDAEEEAGRQTWDAQEENMSGVEFTAAMAGVMIRGSSSDYSASIPAPVSSTLDKVLEISMEAYGTTDLTSVGSVTKNQAAQIVTNLMGEEVVYIRNNQARYGDTLAEELYAVTFEAALAKPELEILPPSYNELPSLNDLNPSLSKYKDLWECDYEDAAKVALGENLIGSFLDTDGNFLIDPASNYTWSDAAKLITALVLGGRESLKLSAEEQLAWCQENGYLEDYTGTPSDPINGYILAEAMCRLMGNTWLDAAAPQFIAAYQLNDRIGVPSELANPLDRDTAMQMIYNFLKAVLDDGKTVAETYGIDLDKYEVPAQTYIATNPETNESVVVTVNAPEGIEDGKLELTVYDSSDTYYNDEDYWNDDNATTYTVEVPADTQLTVEVFQAIISRILSGETVIFDATSEFSRKDSPDSVPVFGNVDEVLQSGSNENVTWTITRSGMRATFNSGTENVTVDTVAKKDNVVILDTEDGEKKVLAVYEEDYGDEEESGQESPAAEMLLAAAPAAVTPTEETPTEETPTEETPTGETPTEETPTEETPTEETPTEETPTEETPTDETPTEETPTEETPTEETSTGETPSEEPSVEETPTE